MSNLVDIAEVQRKINERMDQSRRQHQFAQSDRKSCAMSETKSKNGPPSKRAKSIATADARAEQPQTRIVDLNDNVISTIVKGCVDSYKAWWLQTWTVNKQFARCTRAVYDELHKTLPVQKALRSDMIDSCKVSFSKSTRLFRYFLIETYNMHRTSKDCGWLSTLVDFFLRDIMLELKSFVIVNSECINRMELCCKLMAYEVADFAWIDKQSWAVRLTSQSRRILKYSRGGTKFLHVAQAICDGGLAANLPTVCIKYALKHMVESEGVTSDLKDGVESAHVINNLGKPLFV